MLNLVVLCMTLTLFSILAVLMILFFASIPRRLPASTNLLLYLGLSIIDINKVTILSFRFGLFRISKDIDHFLAFIIHRDIVFSLTLISFANLYLKATSLSQRIGITAYTLLFLFGLHTSMRVFDILTYQRWGIVQELLQLSAMMAVAIVLGLIFHNMHRKDTANDEQYHL